VQHRFIGIGHQQAPSPEDSAKVRIEVRDETASC
jgi:hypothetical protein